MPPNDPLLNGFQNCIVLLSILIGLYLISARHAGPLLRYEPRRSVPWGPVGAVLAVMFLFVTLWTALAGHGASSEKPLESSQLVGFMLQEVFIVGGFLLTIAVALNASWRDLGLPRNAEEYARDIFIGVVACLATLAPVLIVQNVLMHFLFPHVKVSGHQLIKSVISGPPDLGILILASLATVVVAPICEEITFRLLLQGWLEKWEDDRLGWRMEAAEVATPSDEMSPAIEEQDQSGDSSFELSPPRRGISGLPHGWFPIIVSALTFGLAHFGYGPEPVPLSLLGLVLGYVYQRTHRIVPGIVVHALFNLFTMIALWRMVYHPS